MLIPFSEIGTQLGQYSLLTCCVHNTPVIVLKFARYNSFPDTLKNSMLQIIQNHNAGTSFMYARHAETGDVLIGTVNVLSHLGLTAFTGDILPSVALAASAMEHVTISPGLEGAVAAVAPKIRRPPNAFILYRKEKHAQVMAENPGAHNNRVSEFIGKLWAAESPKVRIQFKARADALKAAHLRAHPNYQYRPRKPCEKKRRLTKKKKAALAATLFSGEEVSDNSQDLKLDYREVFLQSENPEMFRTRLPTTTDTHRVIDTAHSSHTQVIVQQQVNEAPNVDEIVNNQTIASLEHNIDFKGLSGGWSSERRAFLPMGDGSELIPLVGRHNFCQNGTPGAIPYMAMDFAPTTETLKAQETDMTSIPWGEVMGYNGKCVATKEPVVLRDNAMDTMFDEEMEIYFDFAGAAFGYFQSCPESWYDGE